MRGDKVTVRVRLVVEPEAATSSFVSTPPIIPTTPKSSSGITIKGAIRAVILAYAAFLLAAFLCYPSVIVLLILGTTGFTFNIIIVVQMIIYTPIVFNYLWHRDEK